MELTTRSIHGPSVWGTGAPPVPSIDVPIASVFMVIFILTAASHMYLFQTNRRRGHFFIFSGAMFGFSMIRVISNALRIAWAYHPRHAPLALAANVFVFAGTVILFAVNLFFVQRIFRSRHPRHGWRFAPLNYIPLASIATIVVFLVMVIVVVVQSSYASSPSIQRTDLAIRRAGLGAFMILAFLPLPLLAIINLLPRTEPIDHFGAGAPWAKDALVLLTATILTLGASFRAGTSFLDPTPLSAPRPWYDSTASFYCLDFLTDLIPLLIYLFARADRRFYIRDGAWGPGSYSEKYTYDASAERVWPRGYVLGVSEVPHWRRQLRGEHEGNASEHEETDEEKDVGTRGGEKKDAPGVIDLDDAGF